MHSVQFPEEHTVGKLIQVVRHDGQDRRVEIAVRGRLTFPVDEHLVLELMVLC